MCSLCSWCLRSILKHSFSVHFKLRMGKLTWISISTVAKL